MGLLLLAIGAGTQAARLGPDSSLVRILLFLSAMGAVGWFGWQLLRRFDLAVVARKEAWLRGLPFNVNVDGYLRSLTRKRNTGRVTLLLTFVNDVDDVAQADIKSALMVATDSDSQNWNAGRLSVKSALIVTSGTTSDGPPRTTYGNRRVHKWVRAAIVDGLEVVHTAHPIKDASVMISRR